MLTVGSRGPNDRRLGSLGCADMRSCSLAWAGRKAAIMLRQPAGAGASGAAVALLSLRNIETSYGPIAAIRGVSLDVEEGAIVAVLGANGAGKTTVLKTISGVMDPATGTISFAGEHIQRTEPDRIAARGIAHVPEGRELFPQLSVR